MRISVLLLFFSCFCYGQDIKTYNYNQFGVIGMNPKTVIKKEGNTYKEYNVSEFGIIGFTPKRSLAIFMCCPCLYANA